MNVRLSVTTLSLTALLSGLPLNALHNQAPAPRAEEALGGLDPVRLVQGEEIDGKDALTVTHHGLAYYFASLETKAAFEADPARYAVQADGLCARMGAPVDGQQSLHAIHDGRVYVFGSEECHKQFVARPDRFLDRAPSPLSGATPEAIARGQALVARAVAAMGGEQALKGVTGFREKIRQEISTMQGPATVRVATTALLPDRWRRESSTPYGDFVLVVAPDAAYRAGGRSAPRPMSPALRTYYVQQFGAHPLLLLRGHRTAGFRAAALAPVTEQGATVERVAIEHEGTAVVVALDDTGRIRSFSARGRSPRDGDVGDVVQTLSDYRSVGSLSLPFRVDATFNGAPQATLSYQVETLEINPAIEASALVRPPEARR